jgi:GSH-dependent disulfide-bond oxidoreductase
MVQMTTIGPMWGQYVHFTRFAPSGNQYSLDRYRTQAIKTLDVVEGRLGQSAYLGGGEYSIADIATFPWLRTTGLFLGKDVEARYPKVAAWVGKIAVRPAVVKALAAVDEVRGKVTQFDQAGDAGKDRLFGRGRHTAAA